MLSRKEQSILDSLEAKSCEKGVEIVTVEIAGAKKAPLIRVYIDTPEGVSFAELSEAQEWIGEIIEDIDPFPGAYTLEVSSPGIDRPLRTPAHFMDAVGSQCRVRLASPMDGRSNFKGELVGADGDSVKVECDGEVFCIGLTQIAKANTIGKIEF